MSESVSELTVPTLDATSSLRTSTTLGEAKQVEIESSFNTERLGQLSLSNNEYPIHQADWLEINDLLRSKGCDPITLVHPSSYNESHGHVIFTEASVSSLRRILVWCLTDSKYSKSVMDFPRTKKEENAFESKTNTDDGAKEKKRVTGQNLEQRIDFLQREIDQLRNSLQAEDISGRKQSKLAANTGQIKFDSSNANEVEILSLKLCKSKKKCARVKLKMEELKTVNQDLLSQLTAVKEELTMKDNEKKVPAKAEVEMGVLEKLALSSRNAAEEPKTNKDVYKSLLKLQRNACPSEKIYKHLKKLDEEILARDIVGLIEHISENYKHLISSPNPLDGFENVELLKLLVGHFMKLFNVNNVGGVLTRMHEVYAKYYEHQNTLHAITEILHLGSNMPSYLLVEIIGQLNKARHLLHIRNLNRVIKQIENYDQFYIKFHKLIKEIMYLLAVDSIDHVLPSLRLLLKVT